MLFNTRTTDKKFFFIFREFQGERGVHLNLFYWREALDKGFK